MVECSGLERIRARPSCGSRTSDTARAVARVGERGDGGDGRDGRPTDPTERESQRPVWIGRMGGGDGGAAGAGCESPPDRTPAETGGNVECPHSMPPLQLQGPQANQLSVLTDNGAQAIGVNGIFELTVPEGTDQWPCIEGSDVREQLDLAVVT